MRWSPAIQALRSFLLGLTVLCAAPVVRSEPPSEPPSGWQLGSWVVAPSLSLESAAEDNIFRRNSTTGGRVADRYTTARGAVAATLPFRQSWLRLTYGAEVLTYQDLPDPERNVSQDLGFELEFNLSRGDRITISEQYARGFTEVQQFDDSGELTFEGRPFDYSEASFEWNREVPGTRGYQARLTRRDLNFATDETFSYFDYRGWNAMLAYREPVARNQWIELRYDGRRYDHFFPDAGTPVGVPTRQQVTDQLLAGLRASFSRSGGYYVRLGYGEFDYRLVPSAPFRGLVAQAGLNLDVGSVRLNVDARRQPMASFFDTFIESDRVLVGLIREWQRLQVGGSAQLVRNRYGGPVPCGTVTCMRADDILYAEIYGQFSPHPRVGLRASAQHQDRSSNSTLANYDVTTVRFAVVLGWLE